MIRDEKPVADVFYTTRGRNRFSFEGIVVRGGLARCDESRATRNQVICFGHGSRIEITLLNEQRVATHSVRTSPSFRHRLLFAIGLGVACAVYVVLLGRANPDFTSDFDQVWAGARALLHNKDPYAVVGPGREFGWRWPLYYPFPALLVVAPVGLMPVLAARATFSGISAALLCWAITRDNWSRLPIFLSVSFVVTMDLGQWSALYAAAFFLPALGFAASAKPNFGLALAATSPRQPTLIWILIGSVFLIALSQVLQPGWHESWLTNLRAAPHFKS